MKSITWQSARQTLTLQSLDFCGPFLCFQVLQLNQVLRVRNLKNLKWCSLTEISPKVREHKKAHKHTALLICCAAFTGGCWIKICLAMVVDSCLLTLRSALEISSRLLMYFKPWVCLFTVKHTPYTSSHRVLEPAFDTKPWYKAPVASCRPCNLYVETLQW